MSQEMLNSLIAELGLESLPQEKQVEMIERVGKVVFQGSLIRALDLMTEEQKDVFDEFLQQKEQSIEEVLGYLRTNFANFDEIIAQELTKLKKDSSDILPE